jgi:hypothetical protein
MAVKNNLRTRISKRLRRLIFEHVQLGECFHCSDYAASGWSKEQKGGLLLLLLLLLLFYFVIISEVRLSPLGTAATAGLLYQPQMIDDGDCGAIGGMRIGRGNRSTRKESASVPLYLPQIPYDQTRSRTRTCVVESQRLTAWAMARPEDILSLITRKSQTLSLLLYRGITVWYVHESMSHWLRSA